MPKVGSGAASVRAFATDILNAIDLIDLSVSPPSPREFKRFSFEPEIWTRIKGLDSGKKYADIFQLYDHNRGPLRPIDR